MLKASNKIAFVLVKKHKPFSDGEDIVKPCLYKITKWVGDERKVNKITLSKQTITRHIEDLSHDVSEQQEDRVHTCSFLLALDESADICDVVQLRIFIRGSNDNSFNIFEEIIGLESLHGKTRVSDIFDEVKSYLESKQFNLLHSYASVLMEHCQ